MDIRPSSFMHEDDDSESDEDHFDKMFNQESRQSLQAQGRRMVVVDSAAFSNTNAKIPKEETKTH